MENGLTIGVGGCLGEARAGIAGSSEEAVEWLGFGSYIHGLKNEAYEMAEASDEWRGVHDEWIACMSGEGYHVTSPDDAQSQALSGAADNTGRPVHETTPTEVAEARPTDLEIRVATADAKCRQETRLEAVWNSQISLAEQAVILGNPELVLGWVEAAGTMRAVVADILRTVPNPEDDPASGYSVPDAP